MSNDIIIIVMLSLIAIMFLVLIIELVKYNKETRLLIKYKKEINNLEEFKNVFLDGNFYAKELNDNDDLLKITINKKRIVEVYINENMIRKTARKNKEVNKNEE